MNRCLLHNHNTLIPLDGSVGNRAARGVVYGQEKPTVAEVGQ